MQIEYLRQAAKATSKIKNLFKKNIKEAIEKLPDGDIKKLGLFKRISASCWRLSHILSSP